MITISKLAKLSGVSEKAIRLYEKRGLISKPNRHDNNYRFFNEEHVKEIKKILSLKSLGLSLKEIKIFIFSLEKNSEKNLKEFYLKQLIKTNQELLVLEKRKLALTRAVNVTDQLLTSKIIKSSKGVTMNRDMEELFALKERAKIKYAKYGVNAIKYIEREKFFDSEDKIQFIEDVKAVIQFLKKTKIKIGPLRGPASTSLLLDLLGINCINPLDYGLTPERFSKDNLSLDFHVEFARGSEFIWFCKELTHKRNYKFEAYKYPIIDIISSDEERIEKKIDYTKLDDFDDDFKKIMSENDFEFLPNIDFPENTHCFKFYEKNDKTKEWRTSEHLKILRPQNVYDIWGFIALEGRPVSKQKFTEFIHNKPHKVLKQLPDFIQKIMHKNRGHLVYQEELLEILAHYFNDDYNLAEKVRRDMRLIGKEVLLKMNLPVLVRDFLMEEHDSLFNFSHIVSNWQNTKVAAYLKIHHRKIYLEEIAKFEKLNPAYSWADFGFKMDGVSLMQN